VKLGALFSPLDQESRLLRRAAGGDLRALDLLYDDHVDALYTFVFYRTGRDTELAEDVVQETFAKALADIDRFDPERGSLRAWLITLSRNVVRDHMRARQRLAVVETWDRIDQALSQAFAALDQRPLSDEVIERAETRDLVNMTIANLPDQYRTVLERKYIEGVSVSELAAWLGMSPDAAKSLLARARRAFREAFCTLSESMAEVGR
jgi:RNA polymerase sigma-70 factor (ECF subfamily)